MTAASPAPVIPSQSDVSASQDPASQGPAPEGWRAVRDDPDIQFDEFAIAPPEVREPGWFDEVWRWIAESLGGLFGPVGELMAINWTLVKWVLLGVLALFVLYWLVRNFGPLARIRSDAKAESEGAASDPNWQPSEEESVALLADADRLAAEGRFDEATHLLLKRSVSQIAKAQPTWVDPSSTARELAALPALSERAATAFGTIAQRVERSLFALRPLDKSDWEAARAAYANFAQISIRATQVSETKGAAA